MVEEFICYLFICYLFVACELRFESELLLIYEPFTIHNEYSEYRFYDSILGRLW